MSEQAKVDLKTYGAGLLGFIVVVGLGAALILPRGGAAKAPVSSYAPVDAAADMPKPLPMRASADAGAPLASPAAVAPASSPLPVMPRDEAPAASPAPVSATAGTTTAARTAKLNPTGHLDSSSSARSSASASTAAPAAPKTAAAKKTFVAPKLDLSKSTGGSIAATVHYGVSNRAELMGRAAGPVYNFAGKGGAAGAPQQGNLSGSAMEQVSAVQSTIDKSDLDTGSRNQLDQNLNKVRDAVNTGTSGQ